MRTPCGPPSPVRSPTNPYLLSLGLVAVLTLAQSCASRAQQSDTGSVSGHIYNADTGAPIAGASIIIVLDVPPDTDLPEPASASSEPNGAYKVGLLQPGTYKVTVERTGFIAGVLEPGECHNGLYGTSQSISISVNAGKATDDVDFELHQEKVVSGSVRDQNNQPLAGMFVMAMCEDAGFSSSAMTDDQGNFRLRGLAPGNYYVAAGPKGIGVYQPVFYPGARSRDTAQIVSVKAGKEPSDLRFTLSPVPLYTIRIKAASGGFIAIVRTDVDPVRSGWNLSTVINPAPIQINDDGTAEVDGLPAGSYQILVIGPPPDLGPRIVSATVVDADVSVEVPNTLSLVAPR